MILRERGDIIIRESRIQDIDNFKQMRSQEVAEVWAEGHFTPDQALRESFKNSTLAFTFFHRKTIVAMFGIVPDSLLSKRARGWLLTSDEIQNVKIGFLRSTKKVISEFQRFYPILWNFVDARNIQCVNWLHWIGAKIFDPMPYGVEKMPFHYFTIEEGY